ncbi:hypothetical protein [Actinoplanes sp. GCM10030250]|uniref:hypothetical protein n=1 Tax=Actinoplanes sp. GCM10030250 TaxID=3273376 RepID=UPI00361E3A3D
MSDVESEAQEKKPAFTILAGGDGPVCEGDFCEIPGTTPLHREGDLPGDPE